MSVRLKCSINSLPACTCEEWRESRQYLLVVYRLFVYTATDMDIGPQEVLSYSLQYPDPHFSVDGTFGSLILVESMMDCIILELIYVIHILSGQHFMYT